MKSKSQFIKSTISIGLVTGLILLIPFVAMQFNSEVQWSPFDFMIAGLLIFGTGLLLLWGMRHGNLLLYRIAIGFSILSVLFMIWANLSIGLVGSGPNIANVLYVLTWIIFISGTFYFQFNPKGMAFTMFASSFSVCIIAGIALMAGIQHSPVSSVSEIIGVNGLFAGLLLISGFLYRMVPENNVR
ncbi:MAG TPA: hypothetical protein PKC30_14320 [Saprospiraceae bacterium]|nr:hypothetical protein [Saprospiraceae bacterium]